MKLELSFWLCLALISLFSYLCGSFNGAVIVSKYILRDDVRKHGSGNAGLTNFYRTFGGPLTAVVILTDVIKAVVALLGGLFIARFMGMEAVFGADYLTVICKYWCALVCLLGHMYPIMFGFKGGKGILSGGTIAIMIDWRVALVVWGGFIVLVLLTRYVSLGSVWAGASFPFATVWVFGFGWHAILGLITGGLVVWKHRANIGRLLSGTESKFSLRKKKQ